MLRNLLLNYGIEKTICYHSGIYTEEIVHLIEQNCSLQTKDIKKMPKSNSSRHLFIYSTIYLYL